MNDPVVSVIVLTYNQEGTISRTLDSVLAQRCDFPFEIVIGEDGSTDATRRVCEEYASRHPEMVRLMPAGPNKGLVRNYFDCFNACRGEFIADCSGDDCWHGTNRLQRQVGFLKSHPRVAAVSGDWMVNGALHEAAERPTALDFLSCSGHLPMNLSASLFRASIVREALSGAEQCVCREEYGCEDLPVALALLQCGEIVRLPGVTLEYTQAEGTISQPDNAEKAWDYFYRTLNARIALSKHYGIDSLHLRRVLGSRLGHLAKLTFRLGDEHKCWKLLDLASSGCIRPDKKSRLLIAVMSNRPLWLVMRRIIALRSRV